MTDVNVRTDLLRSQMFEQFFTICQLIFSLKCLVALKSRLCCYYELLADQPFPITNLKIVGHNTPSFISDAV